MEHPDGEFSIEVLSGQIGVRHVGGPGGRSEDVIHETGGGGVTAVGQTGQGEIAGGVADGGFAVRTDEHTRQWLARRGGVAAEPIGGAAHGAEIVGDAASVALNADAPGRVGDGDWIGEIAGRDGVSGQAGEEVPVAARNREVVIPDSTIQIGDGLMVCVADGYGRIAVDAADGAGNVIERPREVFVGGVPPFHSDRVGPGVIGAKFVAGF